MSVPLGAHLASRRAAGRKLFIPYVMAASTRTWLETLGALVDAGADALEVGLPFSDPIIDGPVIQAAAAASLASGSTTHSIAQALSASGLQVPVVAMTYLNVFAARGYAASTALLADAGVTGVIVPDLPIEELDAWHERVEGTGIETVLLAAPSSTPSRLDEIGKRSEGFVYAVGRMATTGETDALDPCGAALVNQLRGRTALPILIGVGISTETHAASARDHADGVIVGSAIVRRMLEGSSPDEVGAFAATIRAALDDERGTAT